MSVVPKILIVSEEVYDRVLIKEYLGSYFEFVEITRVNTLIEDIKQINPDLILFKVKTRNKNYFDNICAYLNHKLSLQKANIIICNEENLFSEKDAKLANNAFFVTENMVEFSLKSLVRKSLELIKVQSLFSSIDKQTKAKISK